MRFLRLKDEDYICEHCKNVMMLTAYTDHGKEGYQFVFYCRTCERREEHAIA